MMRSLAPKRLSTNGAKRASPTSSTDSERSDTRDRLHGGLSFRVLGGESRPRANWQREFAAPCQLGMRTVGSILRPRRFKRSALQSTMSSAHLRKDFEKRGDCFQAAVALRSSHFTR